MLLSVKQAGHSRPRLERSVAIALGCLRCNIYFGFEHPCLPKISSRLCWPFDVRISALSLEAGPAKGIPPGPRMLGFWCVSSKLFQHDRCSRPHSDSLEAIDPSIGTKDEAPHWSAQFLLFIESSWSTGVCKDDFWRATREGSGEPLQILAWIQCKHQWKIEEQRTSIVSRCCNSLSTTSWPA